MPRRRYTRNHARDGHRPTRTASADRVPSAARWFVSVAASLVLAATLWGSLVIAGFSAMCGDQSTPGMVADCYQGARWALVRGAISVVLAIGAIIVARKVKTAEIVWLVGILLLFGAILVSPVLDMLAG